MSGGTVLIGDVMALGFGRSDDFFASDDIITGRDPPTSIPSGELLPDSLPESSESLLDDELELVLDELDLLCLSPSLVVPSAPVMLPVDITGTFCEDETVLTRTPPTLPTFVPEPIVVT